MKHLFVEILVRIIIALNKFQVAMKEREEEKIRDKELKRIKKWKKQLKDYQFQIPKDHLLPMDKYKCYKDKFK